MGSTMVYRRVPVSTLRKRRRGKHHALIEGILRDLECLPAASALQIPVEGTGITLPNLRSAVHRATVARGLRIETASDKEHFYVWKPLLNGRRSKRS